MTYSLCLVLVMLADSGIRYSVPAVTPGTVVAVFWFKLLLLSFANL